MRRIVSLAGVLVAGIGAGVALAAAANAVPDTDEYIVWLRHNGVTYTSEQDAIDSWFALCSTMRAGHFIDSGLAGDVRDYAVFGDRSLDA